MMNPRRLTGRKKFTIRAPPAGTPFLAPLKKILKKGDVTMRRISELRRVILILVSACLMCTVTFAGRASATEGGGGAYPNGAEDFMTGALPPPGTYFINYLQYYTATKFKDKDGNELIPGFKLDAVADVLRLVHVTKFKIFGADYAVHAFLPIVYQDVEFPTQSDNRWGMGDIIVDPIILGWHWKNFHVTTGLDIYIPVGTYDQDRPASAGRNYWTFEPVLAFTYLSDGGFEISSKFMYDFNTENDDSNYQSGQEFHFDYTVGYHIKSLAIGVGGYYYQQMTDDELSDVKVGTDGFKGRVFAIGPQVQYGYKNMSFTLKWQPEFEAENKPEGNKFWFKFMYAF
jgi:hypothetical protein